ncbi:MAG: topology modulation protein [Clostridia bacterium]|jgi:adenylate kinase family enzyme|nr:topology modulation protein [Clostridia bacterium]
MKKVAIIGSGGAGKSTLARKLGEITGIKVYHLDTIFWKPGWVAITREELKEKISDIIPQDSWIIDGNYSSTMEMRLEPADTIIYLDFSSITCLWGITKRRFMYANKERPDIAAGCNEKLDWEFVRWVLTFRHRNRKKLMSYLDRCREDKSIYIFKNRTQVKGFVESLQKEK